MRITLLLPLLFVNLSSLAQQGSPSPSIIPAPVSIKTSVGRFWLDSQTPVSLTGFPKAGNLAVLAKKVFISGRPPRDPFRSKGGLQVILDKNLNLPAEGYRLKVDNTGMYVRSKTEKGAFYGIQTLLQLMEDDPGGKRVSMPYVEIEDYPRYAYRGLHLDVGRHMFPITFIKEYIDLIAHYKLNTFHWHLTEDQGWRIEIRKYPRLTEVGGYREQTLIGAHRVMPEQFDGNRYGGYYTQREIRDIVAYATSRYVTIIPEIEMPGHSVAALSAYPELACGDHPGPFKTREKWGISSDVYCPGKEQTFRMLEDILDEVLALFPSKYIHIGGDECPKTSWKTCSYCQRRIRDEKLRDEHELQSYFIQRIEKHLNKRGRQIIGWDEILEGGLAPNATVMSWRGIKGGIAAAQQDHDVIMSPGSHLYFDHQQSKSPEEPLSHRAILPLEKVYSYNPTPIELTPAQQKHIIGVQANMWTEFMATPNKAWYMLLPRLYALSEVAWTPPERKDLKGFSENRVADHLFKLERTDKAFRVPTPIGAQDTTLVATEYKLDCKPPVRNAKIYYTINGYVPSMIDNLYSGPMLIKVPPGEERILKTVVITSTGRRSVVTTTVLKAPSSAGK